jgi:hypothetical protein
VDIFVVVSDERVPLDDREVLASLERDVVELGLAVVFEVLTDWEEEIWDEADLLDDFEVDIVLEVEAIDTEVFGLELEEDVLVDGTRDTDPFELLLVEEDAVGRGLLAWDVVLVKTAQTPSTVWQDPRNVLASLFAAASGSIFIANKYGTTLLDE